MTHEPDQPPRDLGQPTLLVTVPDDVEAEMLLAMLRQNNIPAFKKSPGAGAYMNVYMASNAWGAEIYVPQQLLEAARELMEGYFSS